MATSETGFQPVNNVQQAVPFLWVADLEASLRFYLNGLGFSKKKQWIEDGKLRWCWLELGAGALMLQEYQPGKIPPHKRGEGVTICFQCNDALAVYHDCVARGLHPEPPFVGNAMWVTILNDPDGYTINFESRSDLPEETTYSQPDPRSRKEERPAFVRMQAP